jgi:hypothetical protein
MTNNVRVLAEFMEAVWYQGDAAAVDRFLADRYVIHGDREILGTGGRCRATSSDSV